MDTKSKNINYRYSIWFKLLAIVFGLAGATILFLGVTKWEGIGAYLSDRISGRQSSFLDKDQYDNYSPSGTEFINDMRQVVELYYDVYVFYQSEEHIKNGGTVTDDRIMAYEDQYRQEYNTTIANLYDEYDLQIENSRAQGNTALTQSLTRERDSQIEYYENVYQQNIDGVAQEIINEDLLVFSDVRERLEKVSGYCYTVFDSNGNYVSGAKKSRQDYEHMPFYMTGRDMSGDNGFYWDTIVNLQMPDGQILLVGLEQEKYDTLQTAYQQSVEEGGKGVAQVFIGFGLCLGALVWLLAIAGKKPSTGKEIHLTILDKPYLDILLVVCAIGVGCLIAFSVMILGDAIIDIPMNEVTGFQINYRTRMFAIATGIVMFWGIDLLGTWFFTAFVKRLRMGSAVRHTLIYKVCHFFWKISGGSKEVFGISLE